MTKNLICLLRIREISIIKHKKELLENFEPNPLITSKSRLQCIDVAVLSDLREMFSLHREIKK